MNNYRHFLSNNLDVRSKSGYEWQAICPFHEDTSPSLSVNIRKGLFICYACGEAGDMEKLANHLNLDSPINEPSLEEVSETLRALSKSLAQTERPAVGINIPIRYFNHSALNYWWGTRNLTKATVTKFRLGYDEVSDEAIIPLADTYGRVLGLIRRRMGDATPRYMYPHGIKIKQCLFGADIALERYRKTPPIGTNHPPLVIVEGSVDAMAAHDIDYASVAILGSRISKEQVELIKRISPPRIIIATDRDRAGREAEIQVHEMLRNARMGILIYSANWNPGHGKDLAEMLPMYRREALAISTIKRRALV